MLPDASQVNSLGLSSNFSSNWIALSLKRFGTFLKMNHFAEQEFTVWVCLSGPGGFDSSKKTDVENIHTLS